MIEKPTKCVLIVDEALPAGVLANTAVILGITLGRLVPEYIGQDVLDGSGHIHKGIVSQPIPVLKGNASLLKTLRGKLYTSSFEDVTVVDFSDIAQNCHIYDEFLLAAKFTPETDFTYLGLLLYGDKKKVNKLTGSMPLLK
jgi:hypothetical protein